MKGMGFLQPYVPVDAGAFIEPAFFQGGIGPYGEEVLAAVIDVLGEVVDLCGIAAGLVAQVEAVKPDAGVAEDAVKAYPDVFAFVFGWNGEGFAVPAYTGFGVFVADGLVAVAVACLSGKGKVYRPVVGKVYGLPAFGAECRAVRPGVMDGGCLGEVVEVLGSAAEVQRRGRCVSQGELPPLVQGYSGAGNGLCMGRSLRQGHEGAA